MRDAVSRMNDDQRYRVAQSKDARFDGVFYCAVVTTGIYCRPSCPAMPNRANVRFYPTAAAAQEAGFRACKRCRPDATPGSPEWNVRADLVGRAMRLIADGVVDREGVAGLARRLGYSDRHLNRQLVAEVGAGPIALARAQRAQTARVLLETTTLPAAQIAFAAGFASVRQFNDTVRRVFALTPSALRAGARDPRGTVAPGTISLRLPFRAPFDASHIFRFLAARAITCVEEGDERSYRRTLSLPNAPGIVELRADEMERGYVRCILALEDMRDLSAAVQRSRRLLDLDADPQAVEAMFRKDPVLRAAVRARRGLRAPGHVDGEEAAVRAVLGQQVSVAGARTVASQLTARYGKPLTAPNGTLTHLFPSSATLATVDPAEFPMTRARAGALRALTTALADGDISLDPGADREEVSARLLALPGIGPWTVSYIRMRALADPDVFMPTDLGVRYGLEKLGQPGDARSAATLAENWRPWRSYALQYIWAQLS
jgi:AraC family transcriptional regulator of adaptative response / DNA-3-methyladenine glycosylase II